MSLSSVPLSQMFLFISLPICYGYETYPLCQCYSFVSEGLSVKVKVLVIQLCPILCNPMCCSPPGSSVCEILQSKLLEWVAISFSRGSSQPRDWSGVSHITGRLFTNWATREATWGAEDHERTNCDIQLLLVFMMLSCVWLSVTQCTARCQHSLSFPISWSLLKLICIEYNDAIQPSHPL